MKKTVIFMSILLIVFSAMAVDRDPLTLSHHGPSVAYLWDNPDQNGIANAGVWYTAPGDCTLESWDLYIYQIIGTPPAIVVHVYDDNAGVPGTELGSVTVVTADLLVFPDWTNIDLTSLALSFTDGESFYITYTVNLGYYDTDAGAAVTGVEWLSGDGSYATTNHTFVDYGGTWYAMGNLFSLPYEMFAEANIETTTALGPMFDINFDSYNFGLTAIGGGKFDTFVVNNIGGGEIVVQSLAFTGDADLSMYDPNVGAYPDTLASGESMTFYVEYYPSVVGDVTGNVAITIDDREIHDVPITGSGYIHNSWADAGALFVQSPDGTQGDNSWSMSTSDLAPGYLHGENFFNLTASIGAIDFWGINWFHNGTSWVPVDTEDPMDFNIIFYDNDVSGLPGTVVQTYTPTLTRTTVPDTTFSSGAMYKYHYELPSALALTDGWVSIQGTSVGAPDDAWFMWSTSPIGDVNNGNWDDTNSVWDWDAGDLAFALYPVTALDPPTNVTVTMNGDFPELSWTDVPGIYNNIYRSETPNGVYSIVGIVADGAGSFLDVSVTGGTYFYYISATTDMTVRQVINHNQGAIRRVPIKKFGNDRMMK